MDVSVDIDYPFPATQVWAVLGDFGNMGWLSALFHRIETEGSGIGMRRYMYRKGDRYPVIHRLDVHDERAMHYLCTAEQPRFFPVTELTMAVTVRAVDATSCRVIVDWTCQPPPDHDPQELHALMEAWTSGIAHELIGFLERGGDRLPPGES